MNREKAQIFAGALSVIVNGVLFAAKFWAGIVTGSVALMADAWHTMSDSFTSVITVATAKLASKKPDKEHPFGHGRWELIATLFIAVILGIIGYEFLTNSIERFQHRESVEFGTLALIITAVSVIIKEALAQYAFYLGRKFNNPVITADGWHSRSDSLSSIVVLIGIIITRFFEGFWWMDSILGMFCAIAIFYAAFKILRESITMILGEEPDQKFIEELHTEVKKLYDKDLRLHHFHLHNYISHKELTFHMRLDKDLTIKDGHDIASIIEDMLEEKYGIAATIHVEPMERSKSSKKVK